jgi:hypothetical protein
MEDLITLNQARKLLGVSRARIEQFVLSDPTSGRPPRLEIADRVPQVGQARPIRRVRRSDVERLVRERARVG